MRGHQPLYQDQQEELIEGFRQKAVRQMRENRTVTLLAIFIVLIFLGSSISSNLGDQKYNNQISAVLVYSGRVDVLKQSLNSFLSQESKDFSKIIIVYDGNSNNDLKEQIKLSTEAYIIKNKIEWIITDALIGEIAAVDLGLSKVTTQFVFLAVGTWNYVQDGFTKSAIAKLRSDKTISQVMIKKFQGVEAEKISFVDTILAGFNFQPSLHRMKNYKLIEGGFTNLTKNTTYGMAAGPAQGIISSFFLNHGFKIVSLGKQYVQAIRKNNFSYKTFQFKNQYLYKRFWLMREQQKAECVVNLQMNKIFRSQHGVRRQTKRQIGNVIKIDKKLSNSNELIELGIDKYVQIGSKFDFLKLTTKKGYDNISELYPKSLHFEQRKFNQQKLQQKPLQNITFTNFKSSQDLEQYLSNTNNSLNYTGESTQIKLAAKLLKQPQNAKNLEAEYFYYNQKYKLDQVKKQLSICVFMEGFNVYSRSKMVNTLASINSQNYSNYQVVFVADQNEDSSRDKFFDIAKAFNNKLINRMKVATYNEDVLGTSGNHFLRMKQYCKESQLVITIKGNSSLIGKQVFNVINAIYQNQSKQQTWMTFFNVVKNQQQNLVLTEGFDSITAREKGTETDQFLIAFRYSLINLIPIQQVIEFKSNSQTEYLRPSFYESQSNKFHIYPLVQLCGKDKVLTINAPVFLYKELDPITNQKCWLQKSQWIKSKSLLKYPLKQIQGLNMTAKIDVNKPPSLKSVKKVQQSYKQYLNCLQYERGLQKQLRVSPVKNFNTFLNDSVTVMQAPNYFIGTIQVNKIEPLPFCFIIWSGDEESKRKSELIIQSIKRQDYKNYTIIKVIQIGVDIKNEVSNQKNNKKWVSLFQVGLLTHSYYNYHKIISSTCTQNSLLMFPNSPLKLGFLYQMNKLHQRENSWMTYSLNDEYVQIHTFYSRVYDLVHDNDFYKTNKFFLEKGDQQLQALALLELCPKYSSRIAIEQVYENTLIPFDSNQFIYLRASYENSEQYQRQPYQSLRQLHQDYQVVLQQIDIQLNLLHKNKEYLSRPNVNSYLSKLNLLQAYQYELLPYLPDNHILNVREYEYLDSKYQIGKYMTGQYTNMTTRFCFTIFGRNNTESNRYIKNLKSIVMQNYTNYHIVFMDDVSDDKTLELSIEYLRKASFPKDRVTYVKNLQRTFATYNIINSGFNFCGQDDVQVRLDGDDTLLGRNVFGLINAVYLSHPEYWIVYTAYKTSQFTYGIGSEIQREEEMVNCEGSRRRFHFIGPLTTWRVKVIRSIPLKYHQMQYGGWLNTLYDDALQFPFFQLSTIKRIKYIPYFTYNYNANYGSNDNSDKEKVKDRIALFEYVVTLDPLQPLQDLNDPRTKNPEVTSLLKSHWGKIFTTV